MEEKLAIPSAPSLEADASLNENEGTRVPPQHSTLQHPSLSVPIPIDMVTSYNEPPPPYSQAMEYPTIPSASLAGFQSGMHPKVAVPPYPSSHATSHPILSPPGNLPTVTVQPTIHVVTREQIGNCVYCEAGIVRDKTDLCCLVYLIAVAIFTFPLGLFALCCIPCTIHRRCNRCGRIG